jgi:hypothetical protein
MIHIKKFLDRVSLSESRQNKDIVLPVADARGLRDEIGKLLADLYEVNKNKKDKDLVQIEMKGGSFK